MSQPTTPHSPSHAPLEEPEDPVISGLVEALADTTAQIESDERLISATERHLESLKAEAHGLTLAIRRRRGEQDPESDEVGEIQDPPETTWSKLGRSAAVLRVLRESNSLLSPASIADRLREVGREDPPRLVNAALAHLKTTDRAKTRGRAEWYTHGSPWSQQLLQNEEAVIEDAP